MSSSTPSNEASKQTEAEKANAQVETLAINTIRTLAMDAVQKANSGHPGTPMALAPVGYTLWQHFMRYDPDAPHWPDRDRFVLSNGHASMLQYALLHLLQVKHTTLDDAPTKELAVSLEDIKNFRQLHSRTPGHPEYRITTGVETTTGPLGQGVATSVGLAMAQKWLAARFNRPEFSLFEHRIWVICGDGDLMEGISSEAASLAGHQELGNLCWIYDDNQITIEGKTDLAFSEEVATRFAAYGWNVRRVFDANDTKALRAVFTAVRDSHDRPTLVIVKSHIGYGSPNKLDSADAHGSPLGEAEIKLTKKAYGWPEDSSFLVPAGVVEHFAEIFGARGKALSAGWRAMLGRYKEAFPALYTELTALWHGALPEGWDQKIPRFAADPKGLATRDSSGKVLNAIAAQVPWLLGGAADLSPSTKTHMNGLGDFSPRTEQKYSGRNFHFGIREHAMAAAVNGLVLSNLRAFGSTFLIFCDYLKPAMRLSAVMELPSIFVFTHDSIGVGEDGPTHQPIEQLAMLRTIPGLVDFRPADANEVIEGWRAILALKHQPAALVLTRQELPTIDRQKYAAAAGAQRGAYVLADSPSPEVILIGTGSEVALCLAAHEALVSQGVASRVVSMPSFRLFEAQDAAYHEAVLPKKVTARVAVEQASPFGWERWVGRGEVVAMRTFGASAPLKDLQKHFGFTVDNVVAKALAVRAAAT